MRRACAFVAAVTALSGMALHGQVVFRSNADEVLVDVSVMRGRSPVTGLSAADFVVTDNGVRQAIRDVRTNSGDIDVTLVIQREAVLSTLLTDTQGQFAGIRSQAAESSIDAANVQVRRLIQPADALRILTADGEVMLGAEPQPRSGRSSILDGLTAAMMLKPTAVGRRQLIIGLTGGTDDRSFVPERSRLNVALRTDTVVHIVALGSGMLSYLLPNGERGGVRYGVGVAAAPLKPIAEATGGRLYQVDPGANVEKMLGPALEEFRTRYLLRYVPTGVARDGWHDIVVTVPSGSFEIRHRRGYEVTKPRPAV
ncbi:MAG: hypothetical protein IPL75_04630 [Acidobacteria bacterium]|nr:hypothetical protein [Acidobacteriota bacterium]